MSTKQLPFAMCMLDTIEDKERGYEEIPEGAKYDPESQTSNIVFMGSTLVITSFKERDSDSKQDPENE